MIVIDEILSAINDAMELSQKHKDSETAGKLADIYSAVLELKEENEELRQKIADLQAANEQKNDLELAEEGFYYKKSEIEAGKKIRYCAACYNNNGKLYPITQGSMRRDYFCTNCKMRYNGWQIPKE